MNQICNLTREADRRWTFLRRAAAFFAMLCVSLALRNETLSDWDSWDYAAQALMGQSSDLLLGRWWFIAFMRVMHLLAVDVLRMDRLDSYLVMQLASALCMSGAVVAGMAWTRRLTKSANAEMFFALMVVLGPMVGVYSAMVMTESPTLLLLALALLAWDQAIEATKRRWQWALAAGLALGIAVDMREQAGLLAAWFVVTALQDPRRRLGLLLVGVGGTVLTLGIGVLGGWAWYPSQWGKTYFQNMDSWYKAMARERSEYKVDLWVNVKWLAMFSVMAQPVMTFCFIPAALWTLIRIRKAGNLAALLASIVPYVVILLINHDLLVNPRYIIPVAFMATPIVAWALDDLLVGYKRLVRLRLAGTLLAVAGGGALALLLGWNSVWEYSIKTADRREQAYKAMLQLPENSVVIAGPSTPVAYYLNRIGEKHFVVIGGWDWQKNLESKVNSGFDEGRKIYVNMDKTDWVLVTRETDEWRQICSLTNQCEKAPGPWPMVRLIKRPTAESQVASQRTASQAASRP